MNLRVEDCVGLRPYLMYSHRLWLVKMRGYGKRNRAQMKERETVRERDKFMVGKVGPKS